MQIFRSLHLQKHLGTVQDAARREPVLFVHHGQPSTVMMAADEFRRLKTAAGEPVPPELSPRRAVTVVRTSEDPLGYDTTDLTVCARMMAADFKSGRTRAAIEAEVDRFVARLAPERKR